MKDNPWIEVLSNRHLNAPHKTAIKPKAMPKLIHKPIKEPEMAKNVENMPEMKAILAKLEKAIKQLSQRQTII